MKFYVNEEFVWRRRCGEAERYLYNVYRWLAGQGQGVFGGSFLRQRS
jgi:hypothetical protein